MGTSDCNTCVNDGACGIQKAYKALDEVNYYQYCFTDPPQVVVDMSKRARKAREARSPICEGYEALDEIKKAKGK